MGKEKSLTSGSFLQELFQFGVYKRNQGRVTRQATFVAVAAVVAFGVYRLFDVLIVYPDLDQWRYAITAAVLLGGLWLSYRVVNYPRFADFLIAVEAEMNKVSWPTRVELIRNSMVVIVVIFILAFVLFFYDLFWNFFFVSVLQIK
jgi:preprotein translocase subunit SecE